MAPKVQSIKEKNIHWASLKLQTFALQGHQENKTITDWETIFANYVFGKEFVIGIYKELLRLNNKKTKPSLLKVDRRFENTSLQSRCTNGL